MPASLYVRRADGREESLPSLELAEAIQIFDAIPWKEEIAAWKSLPPDIREDRQPMFLLTDDSAHQLAVSGSSDDAISFRFNYSDFRPQFGFALIEGRDSANASNCPRSELQNLFTSFFNGDFDAIFSLTAKYPAPRPPENS